MLHGKECREFTALTPDLHCEIEGKVQRRFGNYCHNMKQLNSVTGQRQAWKIMNVIQPKHGGDV